MKLAARAGAAQRLARASLRNRIVNAASRGRQSSPGRWKIGRCALARGCLQLCPRVEKLRLPKHKETLCYVFPSHIKNDDFLPLTNPTGSCPRAATKLDFRSHEKASNQLFRLIETFRFSCCLQTLQSVIPTQQENGDFVALCEAYYVLFPRSATKT